MAGNEHPRGIGSEPAEIPVDPRNAASNLVQDDRHANRRRLGEVENNHVTSVGDK